MIRIFVQLTVLMIFCHSGYALSDTGYIFDKENATYLVTERSLGINDVENEPFRAIGEIPDLLERDVNKAIWIKWPIKSKSKASLVFDFIRQDYVNLYLYKGDSLIDSFQTGFLRKSSDKKMSQWNTIDLILEQNTDYVAIVKIVNQANDPSLLIKVDERKSWRQDLLYGIIGDIVFLSIIFIIALYTLLIYFQNRERAYLFFSLYLSSIFLFYIFILDILRDFVIKENPELTLYFVTFALITPGFYFYFMRHFLNTKSLIPKWDVYMKWVAQVNLMLFLVVLIYYIITKDYYLVADIVRYSVLLSVFVGLFFTYHLWLKRNTLVVYFVLASAVMMVGVLIDLILWTSGESLGEIARMGFVGEIILFSLGLGKKSQLVEKEKIIATESYVDQLKINEKLITDQRSKLEIEVSERTKALKIAKEEAEVNAKVKEEFLSVMSHEIRTPMNAIVGLTHMLTEAEYKDEFDENLTTLRYSVDNLMLLINNILDYNKISAGKVQLETVNFDLRQIINGISHLFKAKADTKGLLFDTMIDDAIPNDLSGDPFRLSQILNNFLSNAIKFTDEGSVELKVVGEGINSEKVKLRFEIQDTGVGIPQSKQDSIFKSFTQAAVDTTRKFGGTGLGLTISKDLITLMNGEVQIKSEVGVGSTFSFSLTFEPAVSSNTSAFNPFNYTSESVKVKHLSVLIVDDNQMNRMILKKFLDKWGVENSSVSGGEEALLRLKAHSYDLVLLDLQMPDMDGYQVAKVMKQHPDLCDIPIIAISADTISNVHDKVVGAGMTDFIAKPFDPDDLRSKMYAVTKEVVE